MFVCVCVKCVCVCVCVCVCAYVDSFFRSSSIPHSTWKVIRVSGRGREHTSGYGGGRKGCGVGAHQQCSGGCLSVCVITGHSRQRFDHHEAVPTVSK